MKRSHFQFRCTTLAQRGLAAAIAIALSAVALFAPLVTAQNSAPGNADPASALAEALSAACRQDQDAFANHLTARNAAAFRQFSPERRVAILQRFVLLEDPGKPLLSTSAQGHMIMHCESPGFASEMRFGASEVRDNLAFIPIEIPVEGDTARSVRFGLVRESGEWKLISLGLLLLDLPSLAEQWAQDDLDARESESVASLRKIAEALQKYQAAFGKLPEDLASLGPPPSGGASPERSDLLDASLAAGENEGYRFRYNIAPATMAGDESERDRAAGFALAATPVEYGKTGRRSFYLDASGTLRGADKNGAVATVLDPPVADRSPGDRQP